MSEPAEPTRAKYVGDDKGVIFGIPQRDLTETEYRALTNEQRARMRASALYDVLTDQEYADLTRAETPPPEPEAGGEDESDGE